MLRTPIQPRNLPAITAAVLTLLSLPFLGEREFTPLGQEVAQATAELDLLVMLQLQIQQFTQGAL